MFFNSAGQALAANNRYSGAQFPGVTTSAKVGDLYLMQRSKGLPSAPFRDVGKVGEAEEFAAERAPRSAPDYGREQISIQFWVRCRLRAHRGIFLQRRVSSTDRRNTCRIAMDMRNKVASPRRFAACTSLAERTAPRRRGAPKSVRAAITASYMHEDKRSLPTPRPLGRLRFRRWDGAMRPAV